MKKRYFLATLVAMTVFGAVTTTAVAADEYDVNFALASNGATATASSGTASSAIDGDDGSRWESAHGNDTEWFVVNLGQARTFNTIQIVWEGAYGSSFTIDYSTDAVEWNNFAIITDQTLAGFPYEQLLDVDEDVTAQYVRFTGVKRGTGYGYSFFEFRVINASSSVLTSLTATAASELAKLGEQVAITIVAKDQNGKTMDGVSVEYIVSPTDAGVVEDGKYKPAKAGLATITAKSGEITAAPISIFTYEGENVALSESIDNSKVIAQSDFAPSGTDAFHAVDANEGSAWQGCPTNTTTNDEAARTYDSWFVLDLGAFYNVNLVTITFEGACSQEYHLDFSADNANWNLAYNYVGVAGVNGHTDMLYGDNLKNSTSVRFVRFYSTKAATEWGMKIFDMKVFAIPGTAPADNIKPEMISATLVSNTFNSAVIAVEATDNMSIAKYNVKDAANEFSGSFAPVDGNITVTGLQPSTTYNLSITALDLVGNESEEAKTVQVTTPVHLYEPDVAAPVPTIAANLVKSVYSDVYESANMFFADWGGGYASTAKKIGDDNYLLLTSESGTYLGLPFDGTPIVATSMKYWHLDIWAEEDGTVDIYPIYGGTEYFKQVTVKGQQWNSIELVLATDYPNIADWSNVSQIKLAGLNSNDLAIDNIYFYTDPIEDDEIPTNVTAVFASASYTSVVLTCQAEDNSDNVLFDVYNGDTKVGTGGGESGKPVSVTVNNLASGQEYTLAVEAYDQNGNKAERVNVTATTLALPAVAPIPTHNAEDVWSLYSDTYTQAQPWAFGAWSQSTVPTEYELATGEHAYLLQKFNYLGFEIAGNTPQDLSAYNYIHIDVYTESDALNFKITPIGGGEQPTGVTTTAGEWTSVDLALNQFGAYNKAQTIQVKVEGAADCFIDNLYFYSKSSSGTTQIDYVREWQMITTNGALQIVLPEAQQVRVFSLLGICLFNEQTESLNLPLDNGIYVLQVGNDACKFVVK